LAKIGYFVLCEDVQLVERVNHSEGQPVQALFSPIVVLPLPFIPTAFTLAFSAGVVDTNVNEDHQFKLEILYSGDSDSVVYKYESKLEGPKFEELKEKGEANGYLQFGGPLKNITFPYVGLYKAHFYFDEELLSELNFRVKNDSDKEKGGA